MVESRHVGFGPKTGAVGLVDQAADSFQLAAGNHSLDMALSTDSYKHPFLPFTIPYASMMKKVKQ